MGKAICPVDVETLGEDCMKEMITKASEIHKSQAESNKTFSVTIKKVLDEDLKPFTVEYKSSIQKINASSKIYNDNQDLK